MVSLVSAGIFDWLIKPKQIEEPYKPAFNISNDFTTKKLSLDKIKVLNKLEKIKPEVYKLDLTKETINLSSTDYFKINSQGITRFSNGK